ncbi:MAG TPA: hypothetical protein VK821_07490 [Dehalococcoidia bacterium]|nr:hypothetical protein [Dehalococcoidia bacterium]
MKLTAIASRPFAIGVTLLGLALTSTPVFADGVSNGADCASCRAAAQSLTVDQSSYKLWPSGARTLLDVVWSPQNSKASFSLVNNGPTATEMLNVNVLVNNHDPLSQTSVNSTAYTFAVPALAPQTAATVTVPLDYAQCDVFLTVDLGTAAPTILRTGNPAAC